MTVLKTIIFLSVSLFPFTSVYGQLSSKVVPLLEPEVAKQDFLVFRDSLFKIHPCIDRYQTRQKINYQFDSCYATLSNKISEIELYKKYKFLLSSIKDGHLYIGLPDSLTKYEDTIARVFPLRLYFTADKSCIICGGDSQILPGSELLSINGAPIGEIKNNLFKYIVSDGSITTKKGWVLDRYFWLYYFIVYGEFETFNVQIKQSGKIKTVRLSSDTFKKAACLQQHDETTGNLHLLFKPQGIAILTIKSFNQQDFDDTKENYKTFLAESFTEIKRRNIKCLLVDVRHNGGGKDVYGSLLYSYLADKPFPYYKSLQTKNGMLPQKSHPNLVIQSVSKDRFLGKVIFLIDGLTFSSAAEFCAIAKSNKRGLFVGEETGGGYYGNNSGNFVEIILPNTKCVVSIPTVKYTMDVKSSVYKGSGIKPDIQILPTIIDVLSKEDSQLKYATSLARMK